MDEDSKQANLELVTQLLLSNLDHQNKVRERLMREEQKAASELLKNNKNPRTRAYVQIVHTTLQLMDQDRRLFLEYLQRVDAILWKHDD